MPVVLSKIPIEFVVPKQTVATFGVGIGGLLLHLLLRVRPNSTQDRSVSSLGVSVKDEKKDRAAVDGRFLRQLVRLLKVAVPGIFTREAGYLLLVALALVARTWCDLTVIRGAVEIESAIISRNSDLFKELILRFIAYTPSVALINSILKVGLNELKVRLRSRITLNLYNRYLTGFTYYKLSNLDTRIANPDQLITQDVDKWCDGLTELYANLLKPVLDIAMYVTKLGSTTGFLTPFYLFAYMIVSGIILTRLRRPLARMTMQEQKLEGEFRFVNSRLITNSEEVAFYQGNIKEKKTLVQSFNRLVSHLQRTIAFRFNMGVLDQFIAKYMATAVGYFVVSRPFLDLSFERFLDASPSMLLEEYYRTGRMLFRMAEAIGRLVLAGRELTRLAGLTARLDEFTKVLDDVQKGHYVRTMVNQQPTAVQQPTNETNATDATATGTATAAVVASPQLKQGSGRLVLADNVIRFEHVPLVTPNGDLLVAELNFEVRSGSNVIVCGPNGCGKSSLFRILAGLWPLFGGTLTKPDPSKLFYIPQRPYMPLGTLRDQILYPHTHALAQSTGTTDQQLAELLERVQLGYILDREGGFDSVRDWMDVLSGGEKQRMAMARLFYHRPQFAILDECTSAVSIDVESFIYEHCRRAGITLFTVSHRKSLWKHHEYYLFMDGRGKFDFAPITPETNVFGS